MDRRKGAGAWQLVSFSAGALSLTLSTGYVDPETGRGRRGSILGRLKIRNMTNDKWTMDTHCANPDKQDSGTLKQRNTETATETENGNWNRNRTRNRISYWNGNRNEKEVHIPHIKCCQPRQLTAFSMSPWVLWHFQALCHHKNTKIEYLINIFLGVTKIKNTTSRNQNGIKDKDQLDYLFRKIQTSLPFHVSRFRFIK